MQYACVLTYLKIDRFSNFFKISILNFEESSPGTCEGVRPARVHVRPVVIPSATS